MSSPELRDSWRDISAKLVNRVRLHTFVAWHRAIKKKKAELYRRVENGELQARSPKASDPGKPTPERRKLRASPRLPGHRKPSPPIRQWPISTLRSTSIASQQSSHSQHWKTIVPRFVRLISIRSVTIAKNRLYLHWELTAFRALAAVHLARFRSKKRASVPIALKYVNTYLRSEHYPTVSTVPELIKFRDVPNQQMPEFAHRDEAISRLVNRLLADSPVPIPLNPRECGELIDAATEDDIQEIMCRIDPESAFRLFSAVDLTHLASITVEMTAGHRRLQVSHRFVDAHVVRWLNAIHFPLESDKAFEYAARQIWGEIISGDNFFVFALTHFLPIGGHIFYYQPIENLAMINQEDVSRAIDRSLSPALPVVDNVTPKNTARDVLDDDTLIDDCVFDVIRDRALHAIDVFQMTHKEGIACATDVVRDELCQSVSRLPLQNNSVEESVVDGVESLFARQCDVAGASAPIDVEIFGSFSSKDKALYASFAGEGVTAQVLNEILWPLDSNRLTDDVVREVAAEFEFPGVNGYAECDTLLFETVDPRDSKYYGNPRDVNHNRDLLLNRILFPLVQNHVTDQQIDEIINHKMIFEVENFVKHILEPLEPFELNDTHIYTRDATVNQMLDEILCEFDEELPIILNSLPPGILGDIIETLHIDSNPLVTSAEPLNRVDSCHRRIDFDFPPVLDWIFGESTFPLSENVCTSHGFSEIVLCLDRADDPLELPQMTLEDVKPLAVFEAPPDLDEDLALLANELLQLILQTDVIPFTPVCVDVHGEEFDFLFEGILSDRIVTEGPLLNVLSGFGVERIGTFRGPVSDVPRLVRANDVIEDLLWEFMLPELPVRSAVIDELLASAVDSLDINTESEFSSEEPLPDEVARLCSIYQPTTRHVVPDD